MAKRWVKVLGGAAAGLTVVIAGMVGYAGATADDALRFPDAPYPTVTVSQDPEVIERGRYLVHGPAHCATCHSVNGHDDLEELIGAPLNGGLVMSLGPLGTRYAANLTGHPQQGLGRYTDAELARVIRTGILPSGELSFFMTMSIARLSDDDLNAVVSYLRTLAPDPYEVPRGEWTLLGKFMLTWMMPTMQPNSVVGPKGEPASEEPSVARGEYLVEHAAFCADCHSPFSMATFKAGTPRLGGGDPQPGEGTDADLEYCPPNLTSHPTGYTGQVTEDQFVERLRAGRINKYSIMPWENIGQSTEADLRSIYRYLRSVPPIDRDVGPSRRPKGWKPGKS